jgi:hypothetical protein
MCWITDKQNLKVQNDRVGLNDDHIFQMIAFQVRKSYAIDMNL